MPLAEQFSCLGMSFLGSCAYNPARPAIVYFNIGDAVAALGFTFAVQQFLRPIYKFRISAYRLKIQYLYVLLFMGFTCTVIGAILPNVEIGRSNPLSYPIVWEIIGGLIIGAAYAATTFISLRPARVYRFNLRAFISAGATLLSAADDDTRADFALDLLRSPHNIRTLMKMAYAWQQADHVASHIKMEELAKQGIRSFTGRAPVSAFYLFAHRRELDAASAAGTFLRIISDPDFCSVLVRKSPWVTAEFLRGLADDLAHHHEYSVQQASSFIQEIARQAILNEESLMAKEMSYDGFGVVPLLSRSLFGNFYILHHYEPLAKFSFESLPDMATGYINRLNGATKLMLQTAVKGRDYWAHYLYSIKTTYERINLHESIRRDDGATDGSLGGIRSGIQDLYKILLDDFDNLDERIYHSLFARDKKNRGASSAVEIVSEIIEDTLEAMSRGFAGADDSNWIYAHTILSDLFPHIGSIPIGVNPLQQQVALLLLQKLGDNMSGFYPPICRVLLPVIGPYDGSPLPFVSGTAYALLRDAVYRELQQRLPELHKKHPEKIADYFPTSTTYDPAANAIEHTYRSGTKEVTALSALNIQPVDFFDERNWYPVKVAPGADRQKEAALPTWEDDGGAMEPLPD